MAFQLGILLVMPVSLDPAVSVWQRQRLRRRGDEVGDVEKSCFFFKHFFFFERSRFMKLPQKVGFGDLEIWIFFWGKVAVRLIKGVWD